MSGDSTGGGFILDEKPVFDWNQVPVGTVADVGRDPKTKAAKSLVVTLSPEARERMEMPQDLLTIPMSYVFGIRRDAVTLDRSLNELRRRERRLEAPVHELLKH